MTTSIPKKLIMLALLLPKTLITEHATPAYISFRSPSRDSARKLVGTTSYHVFLPDMNGTCYTTLSVTPTYQQSFNDNKIAQQLFGKALVQSNNNSNGIINITASGQSLTMPLTDRDNEHDLMAENFYLPHNFSSQLMFSPRVQNIILDVNWYVGFDAWCPGLYARLYAPYVYSRYDLRFQESEITFGTEPGDYLEGFFSSAAIPATNLLQNFASYGQGDAPENIPNATVAPHGIKATGLKKAKITRNAQSDHCLGDIRFEIGYSFILTETSHFGLNIQGAAPTGPKPNAEFLFEPECSNGGHWEAGFGITGHKTIWQCNDNVDQKLTFWLEADITHLFMTKQQRTLDIIEKPLSRYMLALKMEDNPLNILAESNNTFNSPKHTFAGTYAPVANISTREVKVESSIQADITALITYTCNEYTLDFGYNFWLRTLERIRLDDKDRSSFIENQWALKGDAHVYGFPSINSGNLLTTDAIALSATESAATIHVGTNRDAISTAPPFNTNIDTPKLASANDEQGSFVPLIVNSTGLATDTINTSIQPKIISIKDFDRRGAATRGISHKIFTHMGYTWLDYNRFTPYLGFGAHVEIGHNSPERLDCALWQWGIWLKGGLSFE